MKEILLKKYTSCDPIRSDPILTCYKEMNEYMEKSVLKYTQLFFLWATHFGKRTSKTK